MEQHSSLVVASWGGAGFNNVPEYVTVLGHVSFPISQPRERFNRPLAVGHRRGKIINIQRAPLSTPALLTSMSLVLSHHICSVLHLGLGFRVCFLKKIVLVLGIGLNPSGSQLLLKAPTPGSCRGKSQRLKMLQVVIQHEHCIL